MVHEIISINIWFIEVLHFSQVETGNIIDEILAVYGAISVALKKYLIIIPKEILAQPVWSSYYSCVDIHFLYHESQITKFQ